MVDNDHLESRSKVLCRSAERRYKGLAGRTKQSIFKIERTVRINISWASAGRSVKDIIISASEEESSRVEAASTQTIEALRQKNHIS